MDNVGRATHKFTSLKENKTPEEILMNAYNAMEEKGYDPVNQIVGYLLSGDPTYITSYKNARYLILRLERDEILEELVRSFIEQRKNA